MGDPHPPDGDRRRGPPAEDDRTRWDRRWSERGPGAGHPELRQLVRGAASPPGRLLDVAGGASGDAVAFARDGWDVTLVDVSPVAVDLVTAAAHLHHLPVTGVVRDLTRESPPAGPWDVIVVAHYLQRDLFADLRRLLAPGGALVAVVATRTNLERHRRPGRAFTVDPGELVDLVAGPADERVLVVEHHSEAWRPNGRHEAHVVARRI